MKSGEAVNWLINIMADIGKAEHSELWHYEQALMEIREMLETSADVQPVTHARWEMGTGFKWRCPNCGGLTYIPSKFCSNCGARMDGEKDG